MPDSDSGSDTDSLPDLPDIEVEVYIITIFKVIMISLFQATCSICLEDCTFDFPRRLECNHYFHQQCIARWLLVKKTCPYCR